MATKKNSSTDFPGVGFTDAILRVVLSSGGDFDNEDERQSAQHFAIMAMHPDDVDRDGRGPGKIIADLEQFDDAEKFANVFAAAPDLLDHLESIVEMAHSVSANWESGDLAHAARSLERIAASAEIVIAKAKGESANNPISPLPPLRMTKNATLPAKSMFRVQLHVTTNMNIDVEATDEQEAWEIATETDRAKWNQERSAEEYDNVTQLTKVCSCGKTMEWDDLNEAWDCEHCHTCVAAKSAGEQLRSASQKLYDALQRYLMGKPDSELPKELVEGMNEMEAAWHTADGTQPDHE